MSLTRQDVLGAALVILDEYGLADLSMRRLGDVLGVRAGALYHHVPNKQTLLAWVADGILATIGLDAAGRLGALVALRATEAQPRGFTTARDGRLVIVVGELATDAALYRVLEDGSLTTLHHVDVGRGSNWVRVVGD